MTVVSSAHWRFSTAINALWRADEPEPTCPLSPVELRAYLAGLRAVELFRRSSSRANRLIVDSTRGCQLQCTYCYADAGPKHANIKVEPSALRQVRERYQFDDMSMLGGDPLFNWGHTKECLKAVGPVRCLSLVTNGIGLTPERVATLKSCCKTLELSLSVEPPEWFVRTGHGKSQDFILGCSLRDVFAAHPGIRPTVLLTLPQRPKYPTSVADVLTYLETLIGDTGFDVSWGTSNRDPDPYFELWMGRMLTEEWDALSSPGYSLHRAKRGLLGQYVAAFEKAACTERNEAPYTAFTCMPGTAELAVGPDSRLYNCHEHGVLGDDAFHLAEETVKAVWPSIQESVAVRTNGIEKCKTCTAYWHCGGLCYAWESSAQCRLADRAVPLVLQALDVLDTDAMILTGLRDAQRRWFADMAVKAEGIRHAIALKDWTEMINGRLTAEQMAEVLYDLEGRRVDIDAPLWTMPKPTAGAYDHDKLFIDSP